MFESLFKKQLLLFYLKPKNSKKIDEKCIYTTVLPEFKIAKRKFRARKEEEDTNAQKEENGVPM